jgi:hypothetical protein
VKGILSRIDKHEYLEDFGLAMAASKTLSSQTAKATKSGDVFLIVTA